MSFIKLHTKSITNCANWEASFGYSAGSLVTNSTT